MPRNVLNVEIPESEGCMSKTSYSRSTRVADQIRMEIADILFRKIKDPRIQSVTVTDVEMTRDLRMARVFITTLAEDEGPVFQGLIKAKGFIRGEVSRRLSLRYSPELVFKKDESGERRDRIFSLLEELRDPMDKDPLSGQAVERSSGE